MTSAAILFGLAIGLAIGFLAGIGVMVLTTAFGEMKHDVER